MWSRPDSDILDPHRTALIVFDMLEGYRPVIERSGAIPGATRLLRMCRESGVIVCFARADHRLDGEDFTRVVTDVDRDFRPWSPERPQPSRPDHGSGSPEFRVISELAPRSDEFDIPKHRWNAFHGTCLDVTLRAQGIDTVLIIGGSTHVGVASTVYSGRDMDYQMIVVRDGCTGHEQQRVFFLDQIFPRMCRVRTVDQIEQMLKAGHTDSAAAG